MPTRTRRTRLAASLRSCDWRAPYIKWQRADGLFHPLFLLARVNGVLAVLFGAVVQRSATLSAVMFARVGALHQVLGVDARGLALEASHSAWACALRVVLHVTFVRMGCVMLKRADLKSGEQGEEGWKGHRKDQREEHRDDRRKQGSVP